MINRGKVEVILETFTLFGICETKGGRDGVAGVEMVAGADIESVLLFYQGGAFLRKEHFCDVQIWNN